jgi:hypothetical protein
LGDILERIFGNGKSMSTFILFETVEEQFVYLGIRFYSLLYVQWSEESKNT